MSTSSAAGVTSETLTLNTQSCCPLMVPQISVLPGGAVHLSAMNYTSDAMTLSIPALGIDQVVPANSQASIDLGSAQTACLTSAQNVAYYVNDRCANRVASGSLVNESQLAMLIEKLQVATVLPPAKEEPVYTSTRQGPARRATVRGYW